MTVTVTVSFAPGTSNPPTGMIVIGGLAKPAAVELDEGVGPGVMDGDDAGRGLEVAGPDPWLDEEISVG